MENKCLIGISTFRKPDSLRRMLESIFEHGYDKDNIIHVADDAQGEDSEFDGRKIGSALEVVKDFPGVKISYGNKRGGISINKNRSIKAFLESDAQYLLLLDDDQEFIRPGLIEELIEVLEKNRINHVTGQWSSTQPELEQMSGQGWKATFPVQAEGYHVTWHELGSHGCAHFYSRKCLEEIGYWPVLSNFYGLEHAVHTSLAMLAVDKRTPRWHPQHTRASRYYTGQAVPIPNNYAVENPFANSDDYALYMDKINRGVCLNIKESESGLDKGEVVVG